MKYKTQLIGITLFIVFALAVISYQTPYDNMFLRQRFNITGVKVLSSDSIISNSTTTGTSVATVFKYNNTILMNASGIYANCIYFTSGGSICSAN